MELLFEAKFFPHHFFQTTEFVILTDSVKIWHVLLTLFSKATHSLKLTVRHDCLNSQNNLYSSQGHDGANIVNSSLHFLHINLSLSLLCADISADSMGHSVQYDILIQVSRSSCSQTIKKACHAKLQKGITNAEMLQQYGWLHLNWVNRFFFLTSYVIIAGSLHSN